MEFELGESYEDTEWVVKGPHISLERRRDLGDIEKLVLDLLEKYGRLRLSELWRQADCHLWEISLVLKKLKEEGLVEETPL
jgi:hypothetical protein